MTLHILSGGAAQGLVHALAPDFEAETGCRIAAEFGAVGAIRDRFIAGAAADLVILTQPVLAELERSGHVAAGSMRDLGVVHTGIAVRAGDPVPDIGTAVSLRTALRGADAIYFPDPALATAGIHFSKVLRQLGLAVELANRLRTYPNGAAAMHALAGQRGGRPIGCTQITEILGTPGAALAGRLPHELELATTYTCGVSSGAAAGALATQFAARLAGAAAAALRETLGFSPAA